MDLEKLAWGHVDQIKERRRPTKIRCWTRIKPEVEGGTESRKYAAKLEKGGSITWGLEADNSVELMVYNGKP